jgi:hypothetical protein
MWVTNVLQCLSWNTEERMLVPNGTRCQMIRLLVPCYGGHGGQCRNIWASAGSGVSYILCTPGSCVIVHELLLVSCPTSPVLAPSLAGVRTVFGHCPFTSTSLSYRVVALVETGWYLYVYEADVVRIAVLDDAFCCVYSKIIQSQLRPVEEDCLGEHMKTFYIVVTNNTADNLLYQVMVTSTARIWMS